MVYAKLVNETRHWICLFLGRDFLESKNMFNPRLPCRTQTPFNPWSFGPWTQTKRVTTRTTRRNLFIDWKRPR